MNDSQKMKQYTLAFMCFSTLWGFGNVLNGFMYFNGIQVIFSWILMFALYFVPYALMVGELGSAFKNSGGGVSSWIHETTGPKAAYYAGWTYWACHITYIASKGSGGLKALSWMIFQNSETYASFCYDQHDRTNRQSGEPRILRHLAGVHRRVRRHRG